MRFFKRKDASPNLLGCTLKVEVEAYMSQSRGTPSNVARACMLTKEKGIKGVGKSAYIPEEARLWIEENTRMLLLATFVVSTIVMEVLHLLRINVFKFVVLMGTFALAMAFAGNDLVNFIGVPLAGLDSFNDYMANANGASPSTYLMTSLMESAKTPPFYLFIAGIIMIIAMATSKKAQNVIKTSVDLARQDEGDEMFGSSRAARSIVRATQESSSVLSRYIPKCVTTWIDSRFNKQEAELNDGAAFDIIRAAVNLVLASMLITIGTNYKLPLSTTYVTFMAKLYFYCCHNALLLYPTC